MHTTIVVDSNKDFLYRPQEIDEAARRRFVKRLYIPLPEAVARRTIIINLLKQQAYTLADTDLDTITSRTDGKVLLTDITCHWTGRTR